MEDTYRIAESINFPEEEEKILKFWTEKKVFENCLKQSKDKPRFVFSIKSLLIIQNMCLP